MAWDVRILMLACIHYEGHWTGWCALEIETFLGPEMATSEASAFGPEMATSEASAFGPKKVLPMALVMDLPASKSLSPSAI